MIGFWSILIPAVIAIIIFALTKRAERVAEWRKIKLDLYLKFINSISGILEDSIKSGNEDVIFAKASNDLHLLSPTKVLTALHEFLDNVNVKNEEATYDSRKLKLEKLVYEIRRDLKLKFFEKRNKFTIKLWGKPSVNK